MAKVRLLNGKPLMVKGKVALSDNCCCTPTPTGCPTTETITISFTGIESCPGFISDFNGSYVLTETFAGSGIWVGPGADIDVGIPPTSASEITVQCQDIGDRFSIDYRDEATGSAVIFVTGIIPIPPSLSANNNITDCTFTIAKNGTGGIV